jgi:REP element-mobilizing transposase RayT
VLPAEARDIVLESCLKENSKRFELHAVVVMPDHAHLLLSPLHDSDGWNFSLPQIMHAIKGVSARKINLLLIRHSPSLAGGILRSSLAIE